MKFNEGQNVIMVVTTYMCNNIYTLLNLKLYLTIFVTISLMGLHMRIVTTYIVNKGVEECVSRITV